MIHRFIPTFREKARKPSFIVTLLTIIGTLQLVAGSVGVFLISLLLPPKAGIPLVTIGAIAALPTGISICLPTFALAVIIDHLHAIRYNSGGYDVISDEQ